VKSAEYIQVGLYPVGGQFLPHNDPVYYKDEDSNVTGYKDAQMSAGDRIATMVFYVSFWTLKARRRHGLN
jgi:hypothetical protein